MIRSFYDICSQGFRLFLDDRDGLTVHDGLRATDKHVELDVETIHLYSDLKSIEIDEFFKDDGDPEYGCLPWDSKGSIPRSDEKVVRERLDKDPWIIPHWFESHAVQAHEAYHRVSMACSMRSNIRRLECIDGPRKGDIYNTTFDEGRVNMGGLIYEVRGDKLFYLRLFQWAFETSLQKKSACVTQSACVCPREVWMSQGCQCGGT